MLTLVNTTVPIVVSLPLTGAIARVRNNFATSTLNSRWVLSFSYKIHDTFDFLIAPGHCPWRNPLSTSAALKMFRPLK